jgi:hypothetical protein
MGANTMKEKIRAAIEAVLREKGLVFARLESNGVGGTEWAPLYRGQAKSNEVIDALVLRIMTELS